MHVLFTGRGQRWEIEFGEVRLFLSDTSIRRPVLTSMMALAVVLFGALSYTRLSVRELPDVDTPNVSVSVFLRGCCLGFRRG